MIANILSFIGQTISATTIQYCHCIVYNNTKMNKHGCVSAKLHLWVLKSEWHNFQMSRNNYFFPITSQPFKTVRTLLCLLVVEKRVGPRLVHRSVCQPLVFTNENILGLGFSYKKIFNFILNYVIDVWLLRLSIYFWVRMSTSYFPRSRMKIHLVVYFY